MHRAFNLTDCTWENIPRDTGDAIFKSNSELVRQSLEPFLKGGVVDGTKLTSHWFPIIKADIFISHSHKDEVAAITCAGWLKTQFDLAPFIDSCVWGHAAELLKIIDTEYCKFADSETFDYNKRNGSTSHVHMMLSTALSAMLDATECVIFINTRNSITSSESIDKTQSPWLSFELGTMRVIRRKKPARLGLQLERLENLSGDIIKASEYKAEYEVPLSELTPLRGAQLNRWLQDHQANANKWKTPLDLLYEIAPENPKPQQ